MMTRIAALALALALLPGCSDDDDLGPGEVAIEFVNNSGQGVSVFLNGQFAGDVSAMDSVTFVQPFGTFAVSLDLRGDGEVNRFPYHYIGLRPGQRTVIIFNGRIGDRPIFGEEVAIDFRNNSSATVTVFLNGVDSGEVAPGATQTFIGLSDEYQVNAAFSGGGAFGVAFVSLRPGQRTLVVLGS